VEKPGKTEIIIPDLKIGARKNKKDISNELQLGKK